jgi:murein DD-endopeptidase MepM/ murein hydrolase activator NlpD
MRDKLHITISDVHGSKHYTLNQFIKKFILYFALFIIAVILIGALLIRFLFSEVDEAKQRVKEAEKIQQKMIAQNKELEYEIEAKSRKFDEIDKLLKSIEIQRDDLIAQKSKLVKDNEKLALEIKKRNEKFEEIEDKINDLEELIGLKSDENMTLSQRVDHLKLTSPQRRILFAQIPNGYPMKNHKGISAKFGWRRHPILKKKEFHRGLDIRAKRGTPVLAPADGIVEFAGYHKGGFGYLVKIDHNYGFVTLFGHMKKNLKVKTGQVVKKGDVIGYVGSTGLSTGPHLHYEVRFILKSLNPLYFVKWNKNNYEYIFKKELRVPWQSLIKLINKQHNLGNQTKPQS